MRILFIGDIVGRPGVCFLKDALPALRQRENLDIVIANAENASGGSGLVPGAFRQLREAGVDLITLGDHAYKKMDILPLLQADERLCKPANYPPESPGFEFAHAQSAAGCPVAAVSLLGRTYMRPVDCPFRAVDRVLAQLAGRFKIVVVDMHAEATADKYLMAHHLKGRVSAVIGTHTHVQTADEQVFPGGTAFICDVGMTGPYDSILGRRVDRVLGTTMSFVPSSFEVAEGDVRLGGAVIDVDEQTGQARAIRRIMVGPGELGKGAGAVPE
jgi:metallophosphoesterase (TIGR00282 family)